MLCSDVPYCSVRSALVVELLWGKYIDRVTPMLYSASILLQQKLCETILTVVLFKSHLIKHLVQCSFCVRLAGSANNQIKV